VDQKILVDFRLSKGCGIEFKKHFAKIKANCATIIEKGPIMWPTLIASDAIPGVL
jgi:serine/threonine-protein kinase Chk1